MRFVRYTCTVCNQGHRIRLFNEYKRCTKCKQEFVLVPEFLVSQRIQIVFVTGGFGIGLLLGRMRLLSGNEAYDLAQFFLDMLCLWVYAWIFRMVYFQFQDVVTTTNVSALTPLKE